MEILQNKNAATRFQIMVEIAASGPGIAQKSIAAKLGVTPQAISEYIHQLAEEHLVISTGRSNYELSTKGVNWMLSVLRELRGYISAVEKAVTNITVCAAIAECDIERGQAVSLKMQDGVLMASCQAGGSARGVAVSGAKKGDDIDVGDINGLVELIRGKITVIQVPAIQKGGSREVDLDKLKELSVDSRQLGAIGIEALISLRRIDLEPRYFYGVTEAAIEAAQCGLHFSVVCTDDAIPELLRRLRERAWTTPSSTSGASAARSNQIFSAGLSRKTVDRPFICRYNIK
ncbi:MAG: Crp/Fnr family transcriptional regulator [Chloroflexota bacterium]